MEGLEVVVFALEEGLGGDFGVRLGEGLLVDLQVALGEALVRKELKLIVFLDGSMLRNDILVCGDALTVLAFEDVRLASGEAWRLSVGAHGAVDRE